MGFLKDNGIGVNHQEMIPIQNFNDGQGLQGYDIDNKEYMMSNVESFDYDDVDVYLKITFEDDAVITTTKDQLFRVDDEWIMAENLKIGDFCKKTNELSFIEDIEIKNIELIEETNISFKFINVTPNGLFFVERKDH